VTAEVDVNDLEVYGRGSVTCDAFGAIGGRAWGNPLKNPPAPAGYAVAPWRQAVAGSELGHALAFNHTIDPDPALMTEENDPGWGRDYVTRRPLDNALVYQVYP
jgi:hypothetical protein